METIIGIDLGTTNCSVTVIDEGKTKLIKNKYGEYITPSAVYFGENKGEILVGKEAKQKSNTDPQNLVLFVKREMGKAKENVRFDNFKNAAVPYEFWGEIYSPEQISAMILKQLKEDVERELGKKVSKAVITCPAYFGDAQRTATKNAGRIAGLDILEIINEPTAAALSYSTVTTKEKETVLVFDLGGGTFDVTILEISNSDKGKKVLTLATDGDHRLGGKDWDDSLIDYIIKRFNMKFNTDIDYGNHNERTKTYGELRLEVEKAKVNLFKDEVKSVPVTINYGGKSHTENITREKYAEVTKVWTDKCEVYCKNILEQSGKTWNEIDTVLMIGSMSNCKTIQESLKKCSGKEIKFGIINPKTCVSEGAAIQGSLLEGEKDITTDIDKHSGITDSFEQNSEIVLDTTQTKKVHFSDDVKCGVLPASLGIKGHNSAGKELVQRLIKKNTSYPVEITKSFPIGNTVLVEVEVMEGESENPDDCNLLGKVEVCIDNKMELTDKLSITLSVDKHGILQVEAFNQKAGVRVKSEVKRENDISEEEIVKAVKENEDFIIG